MVEGGEGKEWLQYDSALLYIQYSSYMEFGQIMLIKPLTYDGFQLNMSACFCLDPLEETRICICAGRYFCGLDIIHGSTQTCEAILNDIQCYFRKFWLGSCHAHWWE